jgi:tetratricopeptide (TPR) repeat protein
VLFRSCRPLLTAEAAAALARGELARAARCWSMGSICQVALGDIDEARHSVGEAQALAARVGQPIFPVLQAQMNLSRAVDEGWAELAPIFQGLIASNNPALSWALNLIYGGVAMMEARLGQAEAALRLLSLLVPRLERSPVWAVGLSVAAYDAAETLWVLERLDQAEAIERCLEKIVAADFRWPMVDGRLALARLCVLQGRHREAMSWFAEARRVLDEQGARPLLAIADYDEALTYARRAGLGDTERARPLLDSARQQFEAMRMTGWIRRAEELGRRLG